MSIPIMGAVVLADGADCPILTNESDTKKVKSIFMIGLDLNDGQILARSIRTSFRIMIWTSGYG